MSCFFASDNEAILDDLRAPHPYYVYFDRTQALLETGVRDLEAEKELSDCRKSFEP